MSLFSEIWDYVKTKVNDLIAGAVTDLKTWALNRIASAIDAVDWIINNVTKYVTNVYKTVTEYVTKVYNTVNEYVTNVYNNVTKYVTNKYYETNQYITNIVGASTEWVTQKLQENREWMTNFAKLMDPTGFLKDPLGFISAAFEIQRLLAETLVVRSFWMGFEEGLVSEEEG